MLTIALALALAQTPQHALFRQPNLPRVGGAAFDVTSFGVSGPCVATAPTTAGGLALTATRSGDGTCNKQGPATTGILPGDLVVMTTDQPRISAVGSLLMYLRESARTNYCLRSTNLGNAAWSSNGVNVTAPTVTANYGTAADGTLTATRLQIFACPTSGDRSERFQNTSAGVGTFTNSMFLQAVTGTPTVSVCSFGSAGFCVPCALNTATITRCITPSYAGDVASNYIFVGCNNSALYTGSGNTGAADILAWGAQVEAGAWASTHIPTLGAQTTRNADSVLAPSALAAAIGPNFSLGVSVVWVDSSITTGTAIQLGTAATDLARVGRNTNTAASLLINATTTTPAVTAMGTTVHRGSLNDSAGTRTAWWDSVSIAAPAASMVAGTTAISFGAVDSYTGRACADGTSGRCD